MIVRDATEDDIRFVMANLSPWSAIECAAAMADEGGLPALEAALIRARLRLFRLFAICDDAGRPGFMLMLARDELGQMEVAGFTTLWFDTIKAPFWFWLRRSFRRLLDANSFRSTCSIMAGYPAWHAALLRVGYRETGRRMVGGREFIDIERVRPRGAAVDGRAMALRCVTSPQQTAENP